MLHLYLYIWNDDSNINEKNTNAIYSCKTLCAIYNITIDTIIIVVTYGDESTSRRDSKHLCRAK